MGSAVEQLRVVWVTLEQLLSGLERLSVPVERRIGIHQADPDGASYLTVGRIPEGRLEERNSFLGAPKVSVTNSQHQPSVRKSRIQFEDALPCLSRLQVAALSVVNGAK